MVSFAPRGASYSFVLDEDEAAIMRGLVLEMAMLLDADLPRTDPVVTRLFPGAYEDPTEDAAYRDLVGDDLREARRAVVREAKEALGHEGPVDLELTADEVDAWLRLVTDLRVAVGTRLEVDEAKMMAEIDPEDPDAPALSVLHWLGWVQGTMLAGLGHFDPDLRGGTDAPAR